MDLGPGRRRGGGVRSTVVAGSVWETRMKSDEVRGGIKVLAEQEEENGSEKENGKRSNWKTGGKTEIGGVAVSGKRKTWKSEGFEKNPIETAKGKTDSPPPQKTPISASKEMNVVSVDGIRRSPVPVKKVRSEISKSVDGVEKIPIRARNLRSESEILKSADFSKEFVESADDEAIEKTDEAIEKTGSEENCKEFGVCEEKAVSSRDNDDEDEDGSEEFYDEEEDDELVDEVIEIEVEKKKIQVKEMNVPEQKPKPISSEVKKFNQFNRNSPFPPIVHKQSPPVMKRATPISPNPAPKSTHSPDNRQRNFPHTHNKLQNLVDLVMWRDVSKSAFAFGIGTFIIISSSYTKDISISFISVISYLGLAYLAAIFLYRSIICRGIVVEIDETSCVLGEEEAIWLLKLFLPYLNELVLQLKALFSGDPATTMKLAVLLFVLARCGNSITIWKMAKLGFFGVFTVPKVCCSYSRQLTAYGKFWIRRFQDAWDSCTHKKAVAIGIFTLFWNFSSIIARIWAAFMLFVALRYYQHTLVTEGWVEENVTATASSEETLQRPTGNPRGPRQGLRPTVVGANLPNKLKKGF